VLVVLTQVTNFYTVGRGSVLSLERAKLDTHTHTRAHTSNIASASLRITNYSQMGPVEPHNPVDLKKQVCDGPHPLALNVTLLALRHQQRTSYQSISPARGALTNKLADRRCCYRSMGQTDRQTDGRTHNHYIDSASHTVRVASTV